MKLKKVIVTTVFSIILISQLFFASSSKVYAEAYRGLVISEIKFDIPLVQRGTSIKKSFTITHDFQDPNKVVTLYLRALDFTSDNVDGTPKFLAPNTLDKTGSLAEWITFEAPTLTLSKYGESKTVNFTINIPNDAEPGGKYAAVLISDKEGESVVLGSQTSKLGISKELGPLVLMTVDGNIKKGMKLEDIHLENIRNKKTSFFFNPPVEIITSFKNTGNVHVMPTGNIYLYKGSNYQQFVDKYILNEARGYVLPQSTRLFSTVWSEGFFYDEKTRKNNKDIIHSKVNWDKLSKLRFGRYHIKLEYTYLGSVEQPNTQYADISFWVIPWQLIAAIAIILVFITVFITFKVIRKRKRVSFHSIKKL